MSPPSPNTPLYRASCSTGTGARSWRTGSGTDGIWQVDLTDTAPLVREFADVTGYAHAHSLAAADSPGERLRALADYLQLDWPWLVHRCSELGEYGSNGIAAPRSRLLSTDGIDQACRFLAAAAPAAR